MTKGMDFKTILALVIGIPVVLILIGGVLLPTIQAGFPTSTVGAATDYLEDKGYVVLAHAEYDLIAKEATAYAAVQNADAAVDAAETAATNAAAAVVAAQTAAAKVDLFNTAETLLFPDSTARYILLAASAAANTFGNWTEIQDNTATTLSSKFATKAGYLNDLYLYQVTLNDTQWLIEIAYGANKTMLARIMFNTDYMDIAAVKSRRVPVGETIYYRVMSDAAPTEYMSVGFRYFYE